MDILREYWGLPSKSLRGTLDILRDTGSHRPSHSEIPWTFSGILGVTVQVTQRHPGHSQGYWESQSKSLRDTLDILRDTGGHRPSHSEIPWTFSESTGSHHPSHSEVPWTFSGILGVTVQVTQTYPGHSQGYRESPSQSLRDTLDILRDTGSHRPSHSDIPWTFSGILGITVQVTQTYPGHSQGVLGVTVQVTQRYPGHSQGYWESQSKSLRHTLDILREYWESPSKSLRDTLDILRDTGSHRPSHSEVPWTFSGILGVTVQVTQRYPGHSQGYWESPSKSLRVTLDILRDTGGHRPSHSEIPWTFSGILGVTVQVTQRYPGHSQGYWESPFKSLRDTLDILREYWESPSKSLRGTLDILRDTGSHRPSHSEIPWTFSGILGVTVQVTQTYPGHSQGYWESPSKSLRHTLDILREYWGSPSKSLRDTLDILREYWESPSKSLRDTLDILRDTGSHRPSHSEIPWTFSGTLGVTFQVTQRYPGHSQGHWELPSKSLRHTLDILRDTGSYLPSHSEIPWTFSGTLGVTFQVTQRYPGHSQGHWESPSKSLRDTLDILRDTGSHRPSHSEIPWTFSGILGVTVQVTQRYPGHSQGYWESPSKSLRGTLDILRDTGSHRPSHSEVPWTFSGILGVTVQVTQRYPGHSQGYWKSPSKSLRDTLDILRDTGSHHPSHSEIPWTFSGILGVTVQVTQRYPGHSQGYWESPSKSLRDTLDILRDTGSHSPSHSEAPWTFSGSTGGYRPSHSEVPWTFSGILGVTVQVTQRYPGHSQGYWESQSKSLRGTLDILRDTGSHSPSHSEIPWTFSGILGVTVQVTQRYPGHSQRVLGVTIQVTQRYPGHSQGYWESPSKSLRHTLDILRDTGSHRPSHSEIPWTFSGILGVTVQVTQTYPGHSQGYWESPSKSLRHTLDILREYWESPSKSLRDTLDILRDTGSHSPSHSDIPWTFSGSTGSHRPSHSEIPWTFSGILGVTVQVTQRYPGHSQGYWESQSKSLRGTLDILRDTGSHRPSHLELPWTFSGILGVTVQVTQRYPGHSQGYWGSPSKSLRGTLDILRDTGSHRSSHSEIPWTFSGSTGSHRPSHSEVPWTFSGILGVTVQVTQRYPGHSQGYWESPSKSLRHILDILRDTGSHRPSHSEIPWTFSGTLRVTVQVTQRYPGHSQGHWESPSKSLRDTLDILRDTGSHRPSHSEVPWTFSGILGVTVQVS